MFSNYRFTLFAQKMDDAKVPIAVKASFVK